MDKELKRILDEYVHNDVCMAELLADITVPESVSYEQAFETYIKAMKTVEQDKFFLQREDEKIIELIPEL
jgi:hypothetical protein